MKLTIGKRIVMLAHSVMSMLLCAVLALRLILPNVVKGLFSRLETSMGALGVRVMCVGLLAICVALAVAQLLFAVGRSKARAERGFINVDSGDAGRVRIAVSAIEQMVRQSLRGIDGISEMKIGIEGQEDAIAIAVNAVVASGSHVPTLTRNMQRSVRQFVEVNCGVAVSAVSISIDAVAAQSEGIRQRIWGRKAEKTAAPVEPPSQPIPAEPVEEPVEEPLPEPEESPSEADDAATAADAQPQTAPYDFDRPFESEFAKDLAAMRAREASEAGEAESGASE